MLPILRSTFVLLLLASSKYTASQGPDLQELISSTKTNTHSRVLARYLGGTEDDYPTAVAVDSQGAVYVAGITQSEDFPTSAGTVHTSFRQQCYFDANAEHCISVPFLVKVKPDGTVVFSTLLAAAGISLDITVLAIAVDAVGNIYLAGTGTHGLDVQTNALARECNAQVQCAFVMKLDASGSRMIYATYLGGSFWDRARSVAVDSAGRAWVSGDTDSPDYPTTESGFQRISDAAPDGLITVLSPDGTELIYSSYLGGDESETIHLLGFSGENEVIFSGGTTSSNFPVTAKASQRPIAGTIATILGRLNLLKGLQYSSVLNGTCGDTLMSHGAVVRSSILLAGTADFDPASTTSSCDPAGYFVLFNALEDPAALEKKLVVPGESPSGFRLRGVANGRAHGEFMAGDPSLPLYDLGWDITRNRWLYAQPHVSESGLILRDVGHSAVSTSEHVWTAYVAQPQAQPDRAINSPAGKLDVVLVLEDLRERAINWSSARVTGDSASITLFPSGTGRSPRVEVTCDSPSTFVSCDASPQTLQLDGPQLVTVRIIRNASGNVSLALGIFLAPWFVRLRKLTVIALAGISLLLFGCRGLQTNAKNVQVTATSRDQAVTQQLLF